MEDRNFDEEIKKAYKEQIRKWYKYDEPKKYIRFKYILYYFPCVLENSFRRLRLKEMITNDKDFNIKCRFGEIPSFCRDMVVDASRIEKDMYLINAKKFFKYFNI